MTLSIKDPEADRLAREVAQDMGGTITEAVIESLREKRARQKRQQESRSGSRLEAMMDIARHCASLPVLDNRAVDEILGYDENGLPS